MHIPSEKTRHDMESAAELRAAGATWETIGQQLGRRAFVLTRWVRVYRDDWERYLADAEGRATQRSDESRLSLRALLRHRNPRVRLAAAKQLIRQRLAEKDTEPPSEPRVNASLLLSCIEQMSDERLDEYIVKFVEAMRHRTPQGTAP